MFKEKTPWKTYKKDQKLADGPITAIYRCTKKKGGHVYTVKICSEVKREAIARQIELNICFGTHGNIVRFIEAYLYHKQIFFILENMSAGSLDTYISSLPNDFEWDGSQILFIVKEVLKAVSFLHSYKIVHRYIKASTVLLSSKGSVKLSNFGAGNRIIEKVKVHWNYSENETWWASPEELSNKNCNEKVDIWRLGILVIEIIESIPPYKKLQVKEAKIEIIKNDPKPKLKNRKTEFEPLDEFIKVTLNTNPKNRPSAKHLLKSQMLKEENVCLRQELAKVLREIKVYNQIKKLSIG